MPLNVIIEAAICVSMTWQAISARPYSMEALIETTNNDIR